MSETKKAPTIVMPKEHLTAWLEALRSGDYKQTTQSMCREGGYCCLGVLEMVVSGEVEKIANGNYRGTPSPEWLTKHDIKFFDSEEGELCTNPRLLIEGHPNVRRAATLNDKGLAFPAIADLIEFSAKGI
jgi:hypothetical protein